VMSSNTRSVALSEVGHVREHNEDAVFADDELGLWLVADGMGGHASGEVASRMAVEGISRRVAEGLSLPDAIQQAHQEIICAGEADTEHHGMGTTIVALQRQRLGFQLAWAGDSRAYGIEPGGELTQLSYDHSFVQDMVFRGVLSEQEAETHEKKNLINQALGMSNLERLRIGELQLRPQQEGMYLLCSDGVSDMLSREQLSTIISTEKIAIETIANDLTEAVRATEASDNFSFILLHYQPGCLQRWGNRILNRT
jgi:serine/threonine protein phosphatase PrpC